jgi:hypothetical protein
MRSDPAVRGPREQPVQDLRQPADVSPSPRPHDAAAIHFRFVSNHVPMR